MGAANAACSSKPCSNARAIDSTVVKQHHRNHANNTHFKIVLDDDELSISHIPTYDDDNDELSRSQSLIFDDIIQDINCESDELSDQFEISDQFQLHHINISNEKVSEYIECGEVSHQFINDDLKAFRASIGEDNEGRKSKMNTLLRAQNVEYCDAEEIGDALFEMKRELQHLIRSSSDLLSKAGNEDEVSIAI